MASATPTAEERSNGRAPPPVAETNFGSTDGRPPQRTPSGYEQHAPPHMQTAGATLHGGGGGTDYATPQDQTEARPGQPSDGGNDGDDDEFQSKMGGLSSKKRGGSFC